MKYDKKYLEEINKWYKSYSNYDYLSRHTELERFDMPKTFYFRYFPDRLEIHWAIIVPLNGTYHSPVSVYFINNWGRVFDKLEFKSVKIARRRLRRNGFDFSTNRYCPFTPPEPIYIQFSEGKKSAPYSKGNLWQSVQRDKKHIDKIGNTCIKQIVEHYERYQNWLNKEQAKRQTFNNIPNIAEASINRTKTVKDEDKIEIKNELYIQQNKIEQQNKAKEYTAFGVTGGILVMLGVFIHQLISRPVVVIMIIKKIFGWE